MHAMHTMNGMPAMRVTVWTPNSVVAVVAMREMLPVKMMHLPIRGRGATQNGVSDTGVTQNTTSLARQDLCGVPRRYRMPLRGVLRHRGYRAPCGRGNCTHEVPGLRVHV